MNLDKGRAPATNIKTDKPGMSVGHVRVIGYQGRQMTRMAKPQTIDWQAASILERKVLYRYTRDLKRTLNMAWSDVFEDALTTAVGADYENNFRKGKISGERSAEIFLWIAGKAPVIADRIEDDVLHEREQIDRNAPPSVVSWNNVLQQYGRFENIEVYRHTHDLNIVRFANPEPLSDLRLRLTDEFYFKASIDEQGTVGVLQGYKSDWYLLPTSRNGRIQKITNPGKIIIPERDNEDNIDPISEEEDVGKHSFIFIWSSDDSAFSSWPNWPFDRPIAETQLNNFASELIVIPSNEWLIFRCNLMIGNWQS